MRRLTRAAALQLLQIVENPCFDGNKRNETRQYNMLPLSFITTGSEHSFGAMPNKLWLLLIVVIAATAISES